MLKHGIVVKLGRRWFAGTLRVSCILGIGIDFRLLDHGF